MLRTVREKYKLQLEEVTIFINLAFAEANKMIFFETSAKNDIGIKELFNSIAKKIYEIKTLSDTK